MDPAVVSVLQATERPLIVLKINTNTSDCAVSNVMPIGEQRIGKL